MKTHLMKLTAFVAVMLSCATAMAGVSQHPSLAKGLVKGVADSLSITNTSIAFGDKVLLHDMDISIAALDSTAVPELDFGMFNVSVEGEGYRFLPHGTHFDGEGATVRLKYDRTRIPSGYTEDDIRTYYFDPDRKCWVALPRVEVDKQSACVVSKTTHFTDMINGVIVAPESPETDAFTPTMMNDIKAADPTSKINIIMPPTANNRGSANLTYPFEMPPARNGMQPQVALSYNSDGGSGWAGEGWDISIPTIAVDTRWGVPRYNPEFETETYLLNGQMLAMMNGDEMTVAHRQDSIPRDTVRQFFLRQGGDFSKIIRYGKTPGNYHWEITDRNGVVYTYGGNANAVLKGAYTDAGGHQRDVIAEWKLTRVQETHGDYIEYNYSANDVQLYGVLSAKEIYLSSIKAGNVEQAFPHTIVEFANSDQAKTMRMNNARYGFLTTSTRLLDHVTIKYKTMPNDGYEALRTYALKYHRNTTFHKDVLIKVLQLKGNGSSHNPDDTVSYQVFDYYKDVISEDNNTSIMPYRAGADVIYLTDDNLTTGGVTSLITSDEFSSHATALGGSKTTKNGGSFYVGIGDPSTDNTTKKRTKGFEISYNNSNTHGVSSLVDIDGDGLIDKVFIDDDVLKYRPGITSPTAIPIQGIDKFSHTRTHAIGGGYKDNRVNNDTAFVVGIDTEFSWSDTDTYFADVNGDGLVDIVHKRKVYFNCPKYVNGVFVPYFSLSSSESPSPIIATGTIDTSDTEVSQEEKAHLLENSPMVDMVRVWVAQYDGNISITGPISLLPPYEDDEDGSDGIWYSIQKNNNIELLIDSIGPNDFSQHSISVPASVQKGDLIFFRLQSGRQELSNGSSDRVAWNPIITYTGKPNYDTPNGHIFYTFNSQESEVVSDTTLTPFYGQNGLIIKGTFDKRYTSDDVTLRVYTSSERYDSIGNEIPFNRHQVYERTFRWYDEHYDELTFPINYYAGDKYIECEVYSMSNVAWDEVKWIPILVSEKDSTLLSVSYSIFADNIVEGYPLDVVANDTLSIGLQGIVYNPSQANGDMTLTIKSRNKLYAKKVLHVSNGVITNDTPLVIIPSYNDRVWIELFTENRLLANSFTNPNAIVNGTMLLSTRYQLPSDYDMGPIAVVSSSNDRSSYPVTTNLFTISNEKRFGPLYRGWGQFAYNTGADSRYNARINTELLKWDFSDMEPSDTLYLRTIPFYQAVPDKENQHTWYGPNQDIYVNGLEMGCSRIGAKNVDPKNLLADLDSVIINTDGKWVGSTARGFTLRSLNICADVMGSAKELIHNFNATMTGNGAISYNESRLSYMDMNGDGYPDIITPNSIQYTNSLGGFSEEYFTDNDHEGSIKGYSSSVTASIGGSAEYSYTVGTNTGTQNSHAENNNKTANRAEDGPETYEFEAGVGYDMNGDSSVQAFVDINGDGLPDKVYSNGEVRINMGYTFSERFAYGSNGVQETLSKSISLPGGFTPPLSIDKYASSFKAGIGLASCGSFGTYDLIDVNGDGLTDIVFTEKIMPNTYQVKVCLNLGDSFSNAIKWGDESSITYTTSTSESYNLAFTLTIPQLTEKVKITPYFCHGTSMARPRYELKDIDADGFLDVLESDSESELRVKRSIIARTNKLKTVTNSLGGSFLINYVHTTPTYELPCGKWVMSSVEVNYGLGSTDYYIPNSKTKFEYNGGRRDRHEREFIGFAEVVSKQLDTERSDALYRKTVELYDTASIYTAGNLIGSYVQDDSDFKFTEVENEYYIYGLTNESSDYNGGKYMFTDDFKLWNDRGVAYTPLKYTVNKQEDHILSEEWNNYYVDDGDHGLLHVHKYSDKGSLGDDGNGDYDYKTCVNYMSSMLGDKHIFGLPFLVTVSDENKTFHEIRAAYDPDYPNHITQIFQRVSSSEEPEFETTGNGDEGETNNNAGMPPGILFPDTEVHPYTIPSYSSGDCAITSYYYDAFGNIDSISLPRGNDNNPRWYKYHYEDTLNTYITGIDDAFDLSSRTDWFDYRYGISNHSIDQNGVHYHTTTDNLGRLTSVTSPNELPDDSNHRQPSITFEYYPKMEYKNGRCVPAHAITTYYFRRKYKFNNSDKKDVKSMRIVTFVDGFGRVIETRKESYIRNQ